MGTGSVTHQITHHTVTPTVIAAILSSEAAAIRPAKKAIRGPINNAEFFSEVVCDKRLSSIII